MTSLLDSLHSPYIFYDETRVSEWLVGKWPTYLHTIPPGNIHVPGRLLCGAIAVFAKPEHSDNASPRVSDDHVDDVAELLGEVVDDYFEV